MNHYWTEPIKLTFNHVVEKRTMNGETLESHPFNSKKEAQAFLEQKNFYVNGDLVLTT